MKKLAFLVFIPLLLAIPNVSADCGDLSAVTLQDFALQFNVTLGEMESFVDSLCLTITDSTYTKNQTQDLVETEIENINITKQVNDQVNMRFDNLSEWFTDQIDLTSTLKDLINLNNATIVAGDINSKIEKQFATLDNQVNVRMDGFVLQTEFDNYKAQNTPTTSAPAGGFDLLTTILVIIVVAIVATGIYRWKGGDMKMPGQPRQSSRIMNAKGYYLQKIARDRRDSTDPLEDIDIESELQPKKRRKK